MTVRMAHDNVWTLNKIMSRLLDLASTFEDMNQVQSWLQIMKIVDGVRINQARVSKSYAKTANRLRKLRQRTEGEIVLGGSFEDWIKLHSSGGRANENV